MATKPKTPEPSVLDEIVWRHRNIVIPVLWTAMVGVVGGFTTDAVGVASWLVALVAVATGLLAAGAAVVLEEPPRVTWFWFLLLVAAGAYLTWCAAAGWPQRAQLLALIPAGIVFGLWWNVLHLLNTAEQQIIRDDQAKAEQEAASGQWERLLARIGCKGVTVKDRVGFPAGHTLHLKLPANGSVTFRKLTAAVEQLEIAADARPGSLVFEKPKNVGAATVLLHVFERDVLTETLPLEVDRGPKSIHDPIPLGLYQTGEVCVVTFREVAGLMVGLRGRGKSGLLNTHLAHLTGCVDAVVWMIDGKGGRTVRPWLESFLAATTGRPAVDWACMDAESPEAEAILLGVKAAIRSRSRGGGEKIHPGPAMPSIILIIEEASLITGTGRMSNSKRAALAQDAVNTGRSEAVESLLATQRGTVSMVGNGDMKSNQNLRYGLGVSTVDDARMIFPDGDLARAAAALSDDDEYRGVFLMQAQGGDRAAWRCRAGRGRPGSRRPRGTGSRRTPSPEWPCRTPGTARTWTTRRLRRCTRRCSRTASQAGTTAAGTGSAPSSGCPLRRSRRPRPRRVGRPTRRLRDRPKAGVRRPACPLRSVSGCPRPSCSRAPTTSVPGRGLRRRLRRPLRRRMTRVLGRPVRRAAGTSSTVSSQPSGTPTPTAPTTRRRSETPTSSRRS